ncbi:MAG: hypothetical protein P4L84_11040 [Isosphaeraceae bacterium]|nr:hypothetical protein [Isosphaeraceae bacterium]
MIQADVKALFAKVNAAVAYVESEYAHIVALAGRLAILGGAVGHALPAIGQLWRGEVLTALATLGQAAALGGLAVAIGQRKGT